MTEVGTGAVREMLVVIGLALAGVVLALVAAFAPWYSRASDHDGGAVVEMHAPVHAGPGINAAPNVTRAEAG